MILILLLGAAFNLVGMDNQQDVMKPSDFDPAVKTTLQGYFSGAIALGEKLEDKEHNNLLQMYERANKQITQEGLDSFLATCDTVFYDMLVQSVPSMEYYATWKNVAELATMTALERKTDPQDNERLRSVAQNQWLTFRINALHHAKKIAMQRSSIKFPLHFDQNGKRKKSETEYSLEWLKENKDLTEDNYSFVLGSLLFGAFLHQVEANYWQQLARK